MISNTTLNTIVEPNTTSLKSWNVGSGWNIYPNPNKCVVNLFNSDLDEMENRISISDVMGQTVFEGKFNGNIKILNFSNLQNGVYFIQIISDETITTQRILLRKQLNNGMYGVRNLIKSSNVVICFTF